MKLEKWALIAEIVGAVTIVLSLIFVGLQVRQSAQQTALNTRQIQSDSYIGLMSEISGINTMMLENPELIDIQNRARSGAEVSELEFKRLVFLYRRVFTLGGMAWVQYEKELINEEDLQRALAIVKVNQEDKIGS